MSVVIADLVAKIRADTSDVQQGSQVARAELQGVQVQAEQTASALRIMAQEFVKSGQGGTVEGWLENFKRGGVQPTAAALAQAAQSAEKTAAAAVATVAPTQAAARAAEEVNKGWSASESAAVRFGAGVLGVGLGLSLVAGAARLLHDVVVGIGSAQLDWERSLINLSGLYGEVGAKVAALATAQTNLPGVLGTQQEFAQAAINASALRLRYGLPQQTIDQLTTTGGRVAFATGMTDEAQRMQLQQQIAQATQTGAPLPPQYGVYTDPEAVARRLGFQGAQSLQAFTPQQLMQARGAIVSEGLSTFADRAEANQRAALAAVTATEKAAQQAQAALQNNLENAGGRGVAQGPVVDPMSGRIVGAAPGSAPLSVLDLLLGTGGPENAPPVASYGTPPGTPAAASGNIQGLASIDNEQRVVQASQRYATALADSAKVQDDARKALDQLAHSADAAGARLLSFFGSLEDQTAIAHGDILAQAQGAVAARAVGPNPLIYQSPAEIQAQARNRAAQDAWQTYVAPQAQQEQTDAIRRNLEQRANTQGPGLEAQRAAAQQALDDQTRRQAAETSRLQAQQASAFAQRAQIEAQAQLSAIAIQQDERRLSVAVQLAGYRTQALQLEGQLAPILLQQANLQDRITVASRDNLASRRELIAAQQQQLAATQVTSQYDYQQQRLELLAEQSRAVVRQGGAPTQDINALRQQYRGLELERAAGGSDIAALDANRAVQVVGQQRTAEQLARDTVLTNLEAQARALQDQQIPIEQHLRATLLEEQSIQRQLALMDLQDTKAITAAQHALNAANQLALKAAEQERAAADLAANVDLGATAADRFASAMSRGYAAINDSAVAIASVRDMLNTMPSLPTPTAPKPADGGARVPGSEFSIPTVFIPFPKYDQGRAFDQFPGTPPPPPPTLAVPPPPLRPTVPMPQVPSPTARIPGSEFSIPALPTAPPPNVAPAPYTLGSLPTNLPMATVPSAQPQPAITPRPAINPTPDRQQVPLAPPSTVQPQPSGGNTYSFSMPVIINGQTLQQMKDQAHQTLEDAFNNFFAGASTAGPPAPGSVAGAGR